MRIAICDNDIVSCKEINSYLRNYEIKNNMRFEIKVFHNVKDLIFSKIEFDLIFLEYNLANSIAEKLRSRRNNFQIIFITNKAEVILESFKVFPYHCLLKPLSEQNIALALDTILWQKDSISTLTVIDEGKQTIIPSREILYLEGDGKYCIIRTKLETFHSSKTLSEILEHLPKTSFIRIHKSYAVNMQYIAFIGSKYVTLVNGERALISRARMDELILAYEKFINNLHLTPYLNI